MMVCILLTRLSRLARLSGIGFASGMHGYTLKGLVAAQ